VFILVTSLDVLELEKRVKEFYNQSFSFNKLNGSYIRIDTPFMDRHNDSLILYAVKNGDAIKLTDGGYVLDDLESEGIRITRSKRKTKILREQLRSYAVSLDESNNELYVESKSVAGFPRAQNFLIQAMLFVNDMFMLSDSNVNDIFKNEIAHFFEDNNIRVLHDPTFVSNSGMTHKYDFTIAGIKEIPDRLIKTMNSPRNEYYAKALATDVRLTKPVLTRNTEFYTFVNDRDKSIDSNIISLFDDEGIKTIPYSRREEFVAELAE